MIVIVCQAAARDTLSRITWRPSYLGVHRVPVRTRSTARRSPAAAHRWMVRAGTPVAWASWRAVPRVDTPRIVA